MFTIPTLFVSHNQKIFPFLAESSPPSSPSLAKRPASYKVRCIHDDREYLAIFATSEVDKVRRRKIVGLDHVLGQRRFFFQNIFTAVKNCFIYEYEEITKSSIQKERTYIRNSIPGGKGDGIMFLESANIFGSAVTFPI